MFSPSANGVCCFHFLRKSLLNKKKRTSTLPSSSPITVCCGMETKRIDTKQQQQKYLYDNDCNGGFVWFIQKKGEREKNFETKSERIKYPQTMRLARLFLLVVNLILYKKKGNEENIRGLSVSIVLVNCKWIECEVSFFGRGEEVVAVLMLVMHTLTYRRAIVLGQSTDGGDGSLYSLCWE